VRDEMFKTLEAVYTQEKITFSRLLFSCWKNVQSTDKN